MAEETESIQSFKPQPCLSLYVPFAAIIASIGGILFGYDIGIVSGAILQLKEVFSLTAFQQELVVSGVLIGAFCASFFGGNIVDTWGRKTGIAVSCGFFISGSLVLYFSVNFAMLIIGRVIIGIAVSLSVTSECTYISEISPPSRRGMMVSFNEVGITTGFLLAYLVNYLCISTYNGWKIMFGVAAFPAVLQVLGVALMPSSHHYLLIKGKTEKARKVLKSLRNNKDTEEEIEAIITSIDEQKNRKFVDLFSSTSNMRNRMILGMTLVFLQQFSGNANVLYYAPTVFQHFGYSSDATAILASVGLGVVKVVATIVTLLIVDRVGRRSLLLIGCLLMATSIIVLGVVGTVNEAQNTARHKVITVHSYHIVVRNNNDSIDENVFTSTNRSNKTENSPFEYKLENDTTTSSICLYQLNFKTINSNSSENMTSSTESTNANETVNGDNLSSFVDCNNSEELKDDLEEPVSSFTKIISVLSLMTFICAYSISFGPVTWLVLSEIFPGSLRGRAVSVATCVNWGSNIIVSLSFLDILNACGIGPTFVVYGFICYGAALFVFFCVPETKNKSLEEIDVLLSQGLLRKNWKDGCVCKQRTYSIRSVISTKVNYVSDQDNCTIEIKPTLYELDVKKEDLKV